MAQDQDSQTPDSSASSGDTLEFLKIMGAALEQPAAQQDPSISAPSAPVSFNGATLNIGGPVEARPSAPEHQPVVIKGGPRRVVRSDGQSPQVGQAAGQYRFQLSSGHAMFSPQKRMPRWMAVLIGLLALVIIGLIVWASWSVSKSTIRAEEQADMLGTATYDTVLSLTPANDGGYYTVFLVTSTPTDEENVGALSQVVMYRCDKSVTTAIRIEVPTDLSVASTTYGTHSMSDVLADEERGINSAMQGIVNNLGIRLYECAILGQDEFSQITAIMDGTASADSFDANSLVGHVRSSYTAEQLVEFASKIAALGGNSALQSLDLPLIAGTDADGGVVEVCTADQYATVLDQLLNPQNYEVDEWGNPAGTVYATDEWGNMIYDENGSPVIAE